jgi:gluconolactonase
MPVNAKVVGNAEIIDEGFRQMIVGTCLVEKLHGGMLWGEGPVYFADHDVLLWTDIPNDRIWQWAEGLGARVLHHPSNNSNGQTRDREGRLICCEHLSRRITRHEPGGTITVLADNYRGKKFNSPNDVVVKSDGSIWFTDPTYGIMSDFEGQKAKSELGSCYVFRIDGATGKVDIVADDFEKPNGLAFSIDESVLYIADSARTHNPKGAHHIRAFNVTNGKKLKGGRVFIEINPGVPDGFRVDTDGNIWTSAGDGVHCYSAKGKMLGKIRIPELVTNLTFGGPKRNRLFITGVTSLYSIYVAQAGAQIP